MRRELASKRTEEPVPNLELTRPEFRGLRQRRFLACVSKADRRVSHVWVDDEGSCQGMHPKDAATGKVDWSKWHLYQQKAIVGLPPRSIAVRCPSTLESDEWKRIRNDDPPGAMREILKGMLEAALSTQSRQRRATRESDPEESW